MSGTQGDLSNLTFIMVCIGLILSLATPIIYLIWFRKKTKASFAGLRIGALIFVLFVASEKVIQAGLLNEDNPIGNYIQSNNLLLAIVAALFAGVFEETGRYVGLNILKKKHAKREDAVVYGIGHGGIEAFLIGGVTGIINLIAVMFLVYVGLDGITAQLDSSQANSVIEQYSVYYTTPPVMYLLSGFERMAAFAAHMGLTMFVYRGIFTNKRIYLIMAILIHTGFDFVAALYGVNIISNEYLLEVILYILAIIIAWAGYQQYKKTKTDKTYENIGTDLLREDF